MFGKGELLKSISVLSDDGVDPQTSSPNCDPMGYKMLQVTSLLYVDLRELCSK